MHLAMLLQMAADGMPNRVALGSCADGVTMARLAEKARRVGAHLAARETANVSRSST